MKAASLTALAIAALIGAAAPAAAQQINCAANYKEFWERVDRDMKAKVTGEQLAGVNRQALRAYDACLAGDESFARNLFSKIDQDMKAKKN